MSSLTDLRSTLDRHADTVGDDESTARLTAVHHRVSVVRRRRRSIGGATLALVVLAGVTTAVFPRAGDDSLPAAPVVLGQRAPTTLRSLGYTYRTDGHSESFGRSGSVSISASSQPRLYSWTTDGAAAVRLKLPNGDVVHSSTQRFGDFVVVGPGEAGKLTVRVAAGHVGLASYALTGAAPSGYTRAGLTYRSEAAGAPLLVARIGDLGQSVVRTSYVAPRGSVGIGVMCAHLPKGYILNVSLDRDGSTSGGSCDSAGTFDPGANLGSRVSSVHPGKLVHVRAWISRGYHDSRPLPPGSVPDLRIGVGVYGPVPLQRVGGTSVPSWVERDGHTWRLATTSSSTGTPISLPPSTQDRVAELAWHTHGHTEVTLDAGSADVPGGGSSTGGQVGLPGLWIPAGSRIHATLDRGQGRFGIALYARAD